MKAKSPNVQSLYNSFRFCQENQVFSEPLNDNERRNGMRDIYFTRHESSGDDLALLSTRGRALVHE